MMDAKFFVFAIILIANVAHSIPGPPIRPPWGGPQGFGPMQERPLIQYPARNIAAGGMRQAGQSVLECHNNTDCETFPGCAGSKCYCWRSFTFFAGGLCTQRYE